MNHKPLSETNPYLRNKRLYEKFLIVNVSSSAAIELGPLPAALKEAIEAKQPVTWIYVTPAIEKDFSQ